MKKTILITISLLVASCAYTRKVPECKDEKCLAKSCSYEAGYDWGSSGQKAHSLCPSHMEEKYSKGYQAGNHQHRLEMQKLTEPKDGLHK